MFGTYIPKWREGEALLSQGGYSWIMIPCVQTIRLKGYCSRSAHRRMDDIFAQRCELCNACLESWKGTYRWCKHPSKKAVFSRFKPRHQWKSIEIVDADRAMLKAPGEGKNHSAKWWRLTVKCVPQIRFEGEHDRLAAALESGLLMELRAVRTPLRVEVHAAIKHPDRPPVAGAVNPAGLDKGLKSRLVTSDGEHIPPATAYLRKALRVSYQETQPPGQTAASHTGTGRPVGLPPGQGL